MSQSIGENGFIFDGNDDRCYFNNSIATDATHLNYQDLNAKTDVKQSCSNCCYFMKGS
jgi:hypothetical protein